MTAKGLEHMLLGLERKYWEAVRNRDVDTAMGLTDDPCILTGAQGVVRVDKEAFVKMMNAESFTLHDFQIRDDVQVRLLSDDVAIIAYGVREDLSVNGRPVTLEATDASTWVRRSGGWVCALHTESLNGDPFGRDRLPSNTASDEIEFAQAAVDVRLSQARSSR